MCKILVLIPSHNELKNLKKFLKKIPYKIIVGDDHSNDKTKNFLKKNKIYYFYNKKQIGYEKTLIKGFKLIKKKFSNTDYVITMDADGQHLIKDLIKIANVAKSKNFDLIIGERSQFNRFSERILSFLFYNKYKIRDPISGLKCYRFKILNKILNLISTKLFLVDIVQYYKLKNYFIKNISISIKKRIYDKPKIGNIISANFKIIKISKLVFN